MRVLKLHSPNAWFDVLNTSFKDQTIGSRVFRLHPEHPHTAYMGAEADDWQTSHNTATQEEKFFK